MRTRKRTFTIEGRRLELLKSSGVAAGGGPKGTWRNGPFLWITIADGLSGAATDVSVHASRSEVRRIRDALTSWLSSTGDPS